MSLIASLEVSLPVVGVERYVRGQHIPPHKHEISQLAFSMDSQLKISSHANSWTVPPQSALWIPAAMEHEVEVSERSTVYFIHLHKSEDQSTQECGLVIIPALVRELVVYLARPNTLVDSERRRCLRGMIRELLDRPDPFFNRIDMPTERRAARIARTIVDEPDDQRTLADWACEVGACERTLSRIFERQTGMTFKKWQQRCRLLRAVQLLEMGSSVTDVALAVGYGSASAFTALYQKAYGHPPRQLGPRRNGRLS